MRSSSVLLICLCAAASAAVAQEIARPQLTARELFYNAPEAPSKTPTKPASKAAPPRKQQDVARADATQATKPPAKSTTQSTPPSGDLPDGGHLINASTPSTAPAPVSGPALGLKYTILKLGGDTPVEMEPGSVFHAGDKIRFSVETNLPGYLYIVNRGSSGTWKPIFPSPEVASGDNHVEGFHAYMMPPGHQVTFDEQTGVEKLFIVFSRQPETSLENMMYSLQGGKTQPVASPKPEESTRPKQLLVASNGIDDNMIGRLKNSYARDLIVEPVDEHTPGNKKEKAVYVVNPTGSADSRVVADLELVHK